MKLNLPKLPEGLKINIGGKKESESGSEKKEKPKFLAPNLREYWLDGRGFVRRIDLRGTTRKEAKEEKRRQKKERVKELKRLKNLQARSKE